LAIAVIRTIALFFNRILSSVLPAPKARSGFQFSSFAIGICFGFRISAFGFARPGWPTFPAGLCVALLLFSVLATPAQPTVLNTNLQLRLVLNTTNSSGAASVRIAKDPRNNTLYYLKINGDIFQLDLVAGTGSTSMLVYTATDHGLSTGVEGMAIGPDGTLYLTANINTNGGNSNVARVMKGVPNNAGVRVWSLLAQTEPYAKSRTAFDHLCSALALSPDGNFIYLNVGSRTDHGEVQSTGGLYPDLRETGLTAKIIRLPTSGSNLILTNDINVLRSAGYVFAEGTRNAFSLAFAPNGDLFGTDNGPDRDMSDELNWLRLGAHYGFPWRMGAADNPQQFPNYNPTNDLLLDKRFIAVHSGYYYNDPSFPPAPANLADPVINLGPDADSYRDPTDGSLHVASLTGATVSTFTAHRSPLGLVFDTAAAIAPPFQQHGFMLSWTPGDPTGNNVAGPFLDPGQDMVDLDLARLGNTNYQVRVTRLVAGFSNPIDAAILDNKVYVIEYGGNQGVWEVTFPPAPQAILLSNPAWLPGKAFGFTLSSAVGASYEIDTSTDLSNWSSIASLVATNSALQFIDSTATNSPQRFYRVHSP
jgi:hypothetical protein